MLPSQVIRQLTALNPPSAPGIPSYIENGLVLDLNGNDGVNTPATTIWVDRTLNVNNGTLNGFSYSTSSGWYNGALVFDGVKTGVSMTGFAGLSFNNNTALTLELVFSTSKNATIDLFRRYGSGGGIILGLNLTIPGSIYLCVGWNAIYESRNLNINNGQKHHLVIVNNNNVQNIYLDGVNIINLGLATLLWANTNNEYIGYDGGTSNRMSGGIYAVRLYNRVLTASEVQQNYNYTVSIK